MSHARCCFSVPIGKSLSAERRGGSLRVPLHTSLHRAFAANYQHLHAPCFASRYQRIIVPLFDETKRRSLSLLAPHRAPWSDARSCSALPLPVLVSHSLYIPRSPCHLEKHFENLNYAVQPRGSPFALQTCLLKYATEYTRSQCRSPPKTSSTRLWGVSKTTRVILNGTES